MTTVKVTVSKVTTRKVEPRRLGNISAPYISATEYSTV